MHAGRQHRVDEARRVADQRHTGRPERLLPVRVVLAHADLVVRRLGRGRHVRQQPVDLGTGLDHAQPRGTRIVLDRGGVAGRDHGTHAREVVTQRDVPEPAGVERGAEDVAAAGFGQPAATGEVTEHGQVAEELRVHPLTAGRAVDAAGVARRVDHEAGADGARRAVGAGVLDTTHPAVLGEHAPDRARLAHVDAGAGGVAQQDLVEARTFHLERGGRGVGQARRHGEGELPRHRVAAPAERAAALEGEARARDLVGDTEEPAQAVHRGGQQRLADLVPGERVPFQQQHAVPAHGHDRRRGRAGRPSAHDDQVVLGNHLFS